MFKLLVVILAVAYSISGNSADQAEEIELENSIYDLIKELEAVVESAINKARQVFSNLEDLVEKAASKIKEEEKAALGKLEEVFLKQLEELKKKAKDHGVNIDDCLGEDEQQLVHLLSNTMDDLTKCVEGIVSEAIGYIKKATEEVENVYKEIANIKKEINDCGSGWSSVVCLAKLSYKIEKDIVQLPIDIVYDVNQAKQLVENVIPKMKQCGTNCFEQCTSKGSALIAKISTCVAKKIIH